MKHLSGLLVGLTLLFSSACDLFNNGTELNVPEPQTLEDYIAKIDKSIKWAEFSMSAVVRVIQSISKSINPEFDIDTKVLGPLADSMNKTLVPFLRLDDSVNVETPREWFKSLNMPEFIYNKIWTLISVSLPSLQWAMYDQLSEDKKAILSKTADAIEVYANQIKLAIVPKIPASTPPIELSDEHNKLMLHYKETEFDYLIAKMIVATSTK